MAFSPDTSAAPVRPHRNWLTFSLRSLLILVTVSCLGVGGKLKYDWYRNKWLATKWVEPLLARAHELAEETSWPDWPPLPPAPQHLQPEREIEVLSIGILELATSEERHAALRILVESRGHESLPILRDLLRRSRHADVQATLLHLIALDRNAADIPQLEAFQDSPASIVRAAAAESLGCLHQPSYSFALEPDTFSSLRPPPGFRVHLNTAPPIDASLLVNHHVVANARPVQSPFDDDNTSNPQINMPARIRAGLESRMLSGQTQEEREAAARALVAWPPENYSLRLAEWGVWIDGGERLEMARSVLAEIPPFVHGTGDAIDSLPSNRREVIFVTKPVIHLTADRPLAVDLEVAIGSGRPWFVYPRPDGFAVYSQYWRGRLPVVAAFELDELSTGGLASLGPLNPGYPWVHASDRSEPASQSASRIITAAGLRWQSLIVSPQRQPWMTPPVVPASANFAWWTVLRDVPSCWVASQGEAERFLYYDGPSLARSPHALSLNERELTVAVQDMFRSVDKDSLHPEITSHARDCLFIDATSGQPRSFAFMVLAKSDRQQSEDLANQIWLTGDGVERNLLAMLQLRGMTAAEAQGLLASWRKRLLQTPGRRLLSFLLPADYDRFCPLQVRPPATEIVRVGIVLTEL